MYSLAYLLLLRSRAGHTLLLYDFSPPFFFLVKFVFSAAAVFLAV